VKHKINHRTKGVDITFYGFRGGPGGISLTLISLMNELASSGHRIHLVLHNGSIPERKHVHPAIKQIELPNGKLIKRAKALSSYLAEFRPKAVISVREPGNRALTGARLLCKGKVKAGFRVGMPISIALARRSPIKRFLRRQSIKFCYNKADIIIANHSAVAEDIALITGIPLDNIRVIPNGTVSEFLYEQAKEEPDHPWLKKKDCPVILGIGRLAKQKDFYTLIRAFHIVRRQLDAKLIILGEGKERPVLLSLIHQLGLKDSVDLYGHVENPYSFLNRADLFVLSSAWEGLPNALIEAMALGIPSVATDCKSGPREILENGRFGVLVPVRDEKAMGEAILNTLSDPPDPDFIRSGASRYRASVCAQKYLEVLDLA